MDAARYRLKGAMFDIDVRSNRVSFFLGESAWDESSVDATFGPDPASDGMTCDQIVVHIGSSGAVDVSTAKARMGIMAMAVSIGEYLSARFAGKPMGEVDFTEILDGNGGIRMEALPGGMLHEMGSRTWRTW